MANKAKPISSREQKHAVQWVRGELSTSELQKKFGQKYVTNCLYRAAVALREACKNGLLIETKAAS